MKTASILIDILLDNPSEGGNMKKTLQYNISNIIYK